jgi:hypothetical protein
MQCFSHLRADAEFGNEIGEANFNFLFRFPASEIQIELGLAGTAVRK